MENKVVTPTRSLGGKKKTLLGVTPHTPYLTNQVIELFDIFVHNHKLDALRVQLPSAEADQLNAYIKGQISKNTGPHTDFWALDKKDGAVEISGDKTDGGLEQ